MAKANMTGNQKKPVRCIETGEVFESLTAAGRFIGASEFMGPRNHGVVHSHISHAVHGHGGSQTAGGYHWELIHKDSKVSSIIPLKKKEEKLPKIYKAIKQKPPKQPKVYYPPEGYVYIFRNDWHPENVYKIGSTDNLESRRATARTWGPYKCEFYQEVEDCKWVESQVHEALSDHNVSRDDLGSEHFNVPLDEAIRVVKDAALAGALIGMASLLEG